MQVRSRVLGSNLFLTGISGVGGGLVTLLHRTFLSFLLKGRGPHLSFLEGLLVCDCTLRDGRTWFWPMSTCVPVSLLMSGLQYSPASIHSGACHFVLSSSLGGSKRDSGTFC